MKILVTGAAGFVGSHFVEHIIKNTDWEIVALCRTTIAGDMDRLLRNPIVAQCTDKLKIVYHDLSMAIPTYTEQKIGKVDHIIHFGCNSHVERSIYHPMEFVIDNVVGTGNLLQLSRRILSDKGFFINFGTDEQFGPAPHGTNFTEEDRWRPSNPYSASKVGQAALGYAWYVTYGLRVITTQTMNLFGERQNPEKLITKAIRCMINKEPIPIHCSLKNKQPEQIGERHWLHVRNACSAILFLLENGKAGEHYNIVSFDEFNNQEIVEMVGESIKETPHFNYIDFHSARPGHDLRYALDGTKLRKMGWVPPIEFKPSLEKMCKWTLRNKEWLY